MTEKAKKSPQNLLKGEQQRPNGTYSYRWQDSEGKRHMVYAPTLEILRIQEEQIQRDIQERIKPEMRTRIINEMYALWVELKRGLKDNTFQNYQYLYNMFVRPGLGRRRLSTLVKSDVKHLYNTLADERMLSVSTIDGIHTVLHQVLDIAVEDCCIRSNPSDHALRELKQAHADQVEKRRALTICSSPR